MEYSLLIHKNLKNNNDVCIVDENMFPACFFLSTHMLTSFSNNAFNTRLAYGKVLLFVYRYFTEKSIDLVERVASGQFLNATEYSDFKHHCLFKVDTSLEGDDTLVSFARFSGKQLDNLIYATQNTESRASPNTIKIRLRLFMGYISYLYGIYHFVNSSPIDISLKFTDLDRVVKTDIKKLINDNSDVKDPFEKAIPDDVFFKLLEIIKPNSTDNPWKSSRLRNQLIIDTFVETGIRLGALSKLKLSDIKEDWDKPRLMITRTLNDPTDPRQKKASQKTKAHASAISHNTMKRIKLYIATERIKYPKAIMHDFLFVSEKGETAGLPITGGGIYHLIKVLAKSVGFDLTPHLFRHKWNELFDTKASDAGYTQEQIEDIRKYAMGWVEGSKMSSVYNDFKHAVKVHELSAARQNDFVPSQR